MSFPETRHSLIQRLSTNATEQDWQSFLADYWGPVCRFSRARAGLSLSDAEDAAAQVFQTLWQSDLLARWTGNQTARLRTLICNVTNHVLANDWRVRTGRQKLLQDNGPAIVNSPGSPLISLDAATPELTDAFYGAWVFELLQQAIDTLLSEYQSQNRIDCFRTLYGRLCEGLTLPEVARSLGYELSAVEQYNRSARDRLRELLQEITRRQVARYTEADQLDAEFQAEWQHLGDFLLQNGGLEETVRAAYSKIDRPARATRQVNVLRHIREGAD